MKKIVLFILLFGGGLYLLLHLSNQQKEEQRNRLEDQQDTKVTGQPEPQLPFTRIPAPNEDEQEEQVSTKRQGSGISGTLRGKVDVTLVNPESNGQKTHDILLDHVQHTKNDYYDVTGVHINAYDEITGELTATFDAATGVILIEYGRDGKLAVGKTERIHLIDVDVTMHKGSPMAPLKIQLPKADLDLNTGSLYSEKQVEINGDGVSGSGLGLELLDRGKTFKLLRNGDLILRADESTQVHLIASDLGSIDFSRRTSRGGFERIGLDLPLGGELITVGENEIHVVGNNLSLSGRVLSVETKTASSTTNKRVFRAEYAKIQGDASFRRKLEQVTGGVAEVFFDAAGEVHGLTMANEPVARGVIELDFDGDGKADLVPVEVNGVGPMELEYNKVSPAAQFDLPGPSQLLAPDIDFALSATTGIRGSFWGRGLANLYLGGVVEGHSGEMTFEGSNVKLRGRQSKDEAQRLFLETEESARLRGMDQEQRPFEMLAAGGMKVSLNNADVKVLVAREVTLDLGGDDSQHAEIGELRNLDLAKGIFQAKQGVTFSGTWGTGKAQEARGHSLTHVELFGTEQNPATFELFSTTTQGTEPGHVRALHIERKDSKVSAQGQVRLSLSTEEEDQELECDSLEIELMGERIEGSSIPFRFVAKQVTRAHLTGSATDSTFIADHVSGHGLLTEREGEQAVLELKSLEAHGGVEVAYLGNGMEFKGKGSMVKWTEGGRSRLQAEPGSRVEARGRFQEEGLPYILTATWIEYSEEEVQALFPEFSLDRPAAFPQILGGRSSTELHAGSAEWMTVDAGGLLLAGNARFSGKTENGQDVELEAGTMHVLRSSDENNRTKGVNELVAWDGFELRVGDDIKGSGEILEAGYRVLRMEGRPARMNVHGLEWQSNNISYDVPNVLITAEQGKVTGTTGTDSEGWVATYESLQPFVDDDSTIMVMRNPTVTIGNKEIRAKWATFWLDRQEWLQKTREWLEGEEPESDDLPEEHEPVASFPAAEAPTLFGRVDSAAISKVLKEIYYEGDIEYYVAGELVARMQAAYVDMLDGHGWIQGCDMFTEVKVGGRYTHLTVRADWLRHSADGSLTADHATVTSCDYAAPHYSVTTKNLRLTPSGERGTVWDILLKDNSLVFDNGISIPLPRVHYKSDGKGRPTFSTLRFGDSARYGSFVEASVDVDVSTSLMDFLASTIDVDKQDVNSRYRLKASYYGSRGLLLDQRFRVSAADKFWANIYLESIYDSGEDRGLRRTKGAGGDGWRWVLTSQSRYNLGAREWLDFAFSAQSDAGVQAEFSEGQYVHYERRDNFLRWRKAQEQHYYSAEMRWRANSFRRELERLPEIGFYRSLTPIGDLWGLPLLYSASADAALLRSRQGKGDSISYFDTQLGDNLGNQDVVRLDTRHRLELPFDLGLWGVRVSPYVGVAATAWSRGEQQNSEPVRGAAILGAEAQSTFYKTWSHGVVNTVTPSVGIHGDIANFEEDGNPLKLDSVDDPLTGQALDLGLRSRWRVPGGARSLDLGVRATHARHVGPNIQDGWQPLQALGEVLGVVQNVPFAIVHDAHYSFDKDKSSRSYSAVSLLPFENVGVEVAYNRGNNDLGERLYDAVSLGARWDATPKWEFEARQSLSRLENESLSSNFTFRRIGHDFMFELNYDYRSGEGGSSISFKYRPLIGWRRPTFGKMQALQEARL